MSICVSCKRKEFWLLNKDTGNCALKEPLVCSNGVTIQSEYEGNNLKCTYGKETK